MSIWNIKKLFIMKSMFSIQIYIIDISCDKTLKIYQIQTKMLAAKFPRTSNADQTWYLSSVS